jgi:hypothetical protein
VVDPPSDGGYPNQSIAKDTTCFRNDADTPPRVDALWATQPASTTPRPTVTGLSRAQHGTLGPHGDVAPKRHGPCCRGRGHRHYREPNSTTRRAELDSHWQPGPARWEEPATPPETAWSLLPGRRPTTASRAPNSTTRRAEPGLTGRPTPHYHTATLPENGMVLVAGGFNRNFILPRASSTTQRADRDYQAASHRRRLHTATPPETAWSLLSGET